MCWFKTIVYSSNEGKSLSDFVDIGGAVILFSLLLDGMHETHCWMRAVTFSFYRHSGFPLVSFSC